MGAATKVVRLNQAPKTKNSGESRLMRVHVPGLEKVSDHGTIGPRKYFGFQKETLKT